MGYKMKNKLFITFFIFFNAISITFLATEIYSYIYQKGSVSGYNLALNQEDSAFSDKAPESTFLYWCGGEIVVPEGSDIDWANTPCPSDEQATKNKPNTAIEWQYYVWNNQSLIINEKWCHDDIGTAMFSPFTGKFSHCEY